MKSEKLSYIYILSNWSGSVLYVGVTNDLKRRVFEHKAKRFPSFCSRYNVDKLLYYETFADITQAIAREKQLKAGSRRKKVLLISRFNPAWLDLTP